MKIKNTSKHVIECFDGNNFIAIAPGETKDFPAEIVKRMKLIERDLAVVVSDAPAAPVAAPVASPEPARKPASHSRFNLDEPADV